MQQRHPKDAPLAHDACPHLIDVGRIDGGEQHPHGDFPGTQVSDVIVGFQPA